ncbi:CoA transferase [Stappia sp.]|uniref:CaiB/BaiF CoA transferase family protein n=1 Tax=Stappia sp. TaxID=1870903 RepID=UPI0032D8E700
MTGATDIGTDAGTDAALTGLKVLDLGRLGPPAMASMYLADFGADVVTVTAERVDDPGPPPADIWSFEAQVRLITRALNRNKRSVAVNLRDPARRDAFLEMARDADVVIEDFRAGTAERLGIGYETLSRINPRLVYCAMSGYGAGSPMGDQGGHDLNFIAKAGLLDLIGPRADAPPVIPLMFLSDFGAAAMHALSGILIALLARGRTGRGQFIDLAFLDTTLGLANPLAFHLLNGGAALTRGALLYSGSYPHYALYPAKDGRYLSVGCVEPWLWARFCAEIGLPQHAEADLMDPKTAEAVQAEVAEVLRGDTADAWEARLGPKGLCVTAVQTMSEMLASDQARARALIGETRHPAFGTERHLVNPISLSATPATLRRAAPLPGADTPADAPSLPAHVKETDR